MSEAAYQLTFTLDRAAHTVTPATVQAAGVRGDHHAAQVQFILTDPPAGRQYRVEVCDGGGGYDISDLLTPQDGAVTLTIPEGWTGAGIARLRLVEILAENGSEQQVYHYPPVQLQFEERAEGEVSEHLPRWQGVMTAAQAAAADAVAATERAAVAADAAQQAATKANGAYEYAKIAGDKASAAADAASGAASRAHNAADDANTAVGAAQKEILGIREDLEEFSDYVDEFVNTAESKHKQIDADISDVKYELLTLRNQVTALENETDTLKTDVEAIRQTVGDTDVALDGVFAIQDVLMWGDA